MMRPSRYSVQPETADSPPASLETQVTIGLPIYNSGAHLTLAVESLLSQTYRNIRLLISDNASTDGSEQICRTFAELDSRVTYVRLDRNIGGIGNHQRVRQLAKTPYFMWAAGDDIWEPTYIEECMRILVADADVVVAYTLNAEMDEEGRPVRVVEPGPPLDTNDAVARFAALTDINSVIEPFYGIIRTEQLHRAAPLFLHPGFDRILFAELSLYGKLRQVPNPLYHRRRHPGQSSACPSMRSSYLWANPNRPRRLVWPHIEYLLHFASVARRAAPNLRILIDCWRHMARWAYWHHKDLWNDVLGRDTVRRHEESR